MVREIDVRAGTPQDRTDPARQETIHDAAAEASTEEHTVEVASFDPETGGAAVIVSHGLAPDQPTHDYVNRALAHLQHVRGAIGLEPTQAPEYLADAQPQTTSTGAVAVHLRQAYKGIPIYDMAETVRFEPDGRLAEVAGRSMPLADDIDATPLVTAVQALETAAAHLAETDDSQGDTGLDAPRDPFGQPTPEPRLDLGPFHPVQRSVAADKPDLATSFDAPPFLHAVNLSLLWFPLDGGLRLAWHMRLQVPDGPVYRVIVDAADRRVLLVHRLTRSIGGHAEVVWRAGSARQPSALPLPLDTLGATFGTPVPPDLPAGFPDHWLVDRTTRGASVRAVLADGSVPTQGTASSGEIVFAAPAANNDPAQMVVNLFALCSVMHDALYLLGFREADGNFQVDNHGRGGRPSDPVLARVHPGVVWGTANMGTPADGSQPTMNMGLVSSTNRHTALDSDVVFHEYAHGLTNRLVGGPMNDTALDAVQSSGMGEGWSDFFACTMLGKDVVGDWVVSHPLGIRDFRYDDAFPDDFGNLGTGRYVDDNVHAIGEIWCATLLALARRLGPWPTAQIVVDALKLTSANPSFLVARDAVLLAAGQYAVAHDLPQEATVHTVWEVFARFGMGPAAATNGPTLTGIVADFTAPAGPTSTTTTVRASASPGLAIPDNAATGVTSPVTLADAGAVVDLAVTVDITHSYRGDLDVRLQAPDGRVVPLSPRLGGSADDLKRTWTSDDPQGPATLPGLADLRGMSSGGTWALHVADRAPADVGTLHSWSIEVEVADTRPSLDVEVAPGITVPDNDPKGVTSDIAVGDSGTISSLRVAVDITHTYVGDLEVTLVTPDKKKLKLHKRGGGDRDNLITEYASSSGADSPLTPAVGGSITGTWSLQVVDKAGQDVGKLNRWSLHAEL